MKGMQIGDLSSMNWGSGGSALDFDERCSWAILNALFQAIGIP